jgi:PAS domain S-box-containing protein
MSLLDRWGTWLFDPNGLTPHGFCLLWQPGLIWTHAIADAAIWLAYFTIPAMLVVFARRRRDLVFKPVFLLFAAFILLCGTGHLFDVVTLWVPAYGAQAAVKVATAAVSLLTAVAVWRLLPQALALPSPAQLREALAALQESEARHRASFEHSPVPLHTLDGQGLITGVSNSWLALLDYRMEEVIGRHIRDFQAPDSDAWSASAVARLERDGEVRELERRFLRRDGTVVDTLLSARLEQRGTTLLIVCVLVDITARRRAEAALRDSEARLHQAQKMEAVGQLTGGVAHDFNNMLQDIGGCLDMMERRISQGRVDAVRRYVAPARQSVTRAAALTQRMLAFARRQALHPAPVDPDALVAGMEPLIRRTLGPQIGLEIGLHDGVWQAVCDANQLESALLNLVINARDAMPQGGRLTITTADRMLEAGDIAAADDAAPGPYVEITVADTGSGMSEAVLARAFEPFFTTKPIGQGTGLGLSQLYGFVRQSGGLVRIESAPGAGTTVRLFLPGHVRAPVAAEPPRQAASAAFDDAPPPAPAADLQPAAPASKALTAPTADVSPAPGSRPASPAMAERRTLPSYERHVAAPALGSHAAALLPPERLAPALADGAAGGTVLVVEDEAGLRALIGEALTEAGLSMIAAADGAAGLALLHATPRVDLLITDVGLPGMNGREVAEAARRVRPGLPVMLITGYAGAVLDDLELTEDTVLLRKPFSLDALAREARAMLEAPRHATLPADRGIDRRR